MALLDPVDDGELELGGLLRLRIAGAESNFAVGLTRLGVPVTWISRLGADRLGALVRAALAGEGLDLRWVREDPAAPTGLFYKWRADGRTSVAYHRRGSAASRLSPPTSRTRRSRAPRSCTSRGSRWRSATGRGRSCSTSRGERARPAPRSCSTRTTARRCGTGRRRPRPRWTRCSSTSTGTCAAPARPRSCSARATPTACSTPCGARRGRRRRARRRARRAGGRGRRGARGHAVAREEVVDEIGAGDAFAAGFAYGLLQGWARPRAPTRRTSSPRRRCAAPATGRPCRGWTRCASCCSS